MAGVGKLMKQMQKMQKQMEAVQAELASRELTVSSGGGAVEIVITGHGEFKQIKLDPDFLKEDAEFVSDTLLTAINEASDKAKAENEAAMGTVTGGLGASFPGLM
jgi:DNA-binding YbaB/EbfC family protein